MFGGCPRSGLLWALEVLAWKPERLLRTALILTGLSEKPINDNRANKPENSLRGDIPIVDASDSSQSGTEKPGF